MDMNIEPIMDIIDDYDSVNQAIYDKKTLLSKHLGISASRVEEMALKLLEAYVTAEKNNFRVVIMDSNQPNRFVQISEIL